MFRWYLSKIRICLSSSFPIDNSVKQENALLPLLLNCALEFAVMKAQKTNLGLNLNGSYTTVLDECHSY